MIMNASSSQSDLHLLLLRLQEIYQAIKSFDASASRPPIIDTSTDTRPDKLRPQETLPGLRFLREEVRKDCDTLRQFLDNASNARPRPPSTNAPYLIAVWQELIHAHHPTSVYRSFPLVPPTPSARQNRLVKVDVVADNGTSWIRVNTIDSITNSRLMMEFHEMDSYLTSSDDEEHAETGHMPRKPRLAQNIFDNSILKMGRDLLAAAHANSLPIPTTSSFTSHLGPTTFDPVVPDLSVAPRVTLRLTRLKPHSDPTDSEGTATEPRIRQTIDALQEMGVVVELGERLDPQAPPQGQGPEWGQRLSHDRIFSSTLRVNVDLSALIALVSDTTHSPVPATSEDAFTRYVPPNSYVQWKRERVRSLAEVAKTLKSDKSARYSSDGNSPEHGEQSTGNTAEETVRVEDSSTWEISGQHSRALAVQAIQEMKKGLLEEIREQLSVSYCSSCLPSYVPNSLCTPLNLDAEVNANVQFWTTLAARDRCLQIVSKIGGKREKQRAGALLGYGFGTALAHEHILTLDQSLDASTPPDFTERIRAYWEHSRYPAGFLPLVPVRLFKSLLAEDDHDAKGCTREQGDESLFVSLASTCRDILERGGISVTEACPSWLSSHQNQLLSQRASSQAFGPSGSEIPPVRHVHPSLKLTAHTLFSLIAGASRGWTTLTTNRSSVRAVMGEMRRLGVDQAWGRWWGQVEGNEQDDDSNPEFKVSTGKAALWVVDPRSLAEGMRSDLEFGGARVILMRKDPTSRQDIASAVI
ncbi:hypothetical protein F5I97DRAFT_1978189 [Phlebopus sp. FC_14]|nr:hypothetical protein F5I97DRAFT_1978189 [Phlebopus sp. FC_14]